MKTDDQISKQPKQPKEFDIILRATSVGWLGLWNDYRTGIHHKTAAAALAATEKYISEHP